MNDLIASPADPGSRGHRRRGRGRLLAAATALALAPVLLVAPAAHALNPTGVADVFTADAGVLFTSPARGVLANDLGVVPGTLITVTGEPTYGEVTMNLDGTFTYLPIAGYVGVDVFEYCLKLIVGPCLTPPVKVSITVNALIERIGGADRYEVSAGIAHRFAPEVDRVYVASGQVFPDALSASAAAGSAGGPVVLVTRDAIPPSVVTELQRLKPHHITLVGGPATVSAGVETALRAYSPDVTRIDGATRYEVSAGISSAAFGPDRPVAYIASGEVFPDALSGSAAAGRAGGPVLLVSKDSVSDAVKAELGRLKPRAVVVMGGTNTISAAVLATVSTYAPAGTTTRIGGADRYEVSANVASRYPVGDSGTVFVASGEVFPDALSGSARAIWHNAPVVLVTKDTVPATVQAQLNRLNPVHIIVLGGPNTISDANYAALRGYLG